METKRATSPAASKSRRLMVREEKKGVFLLSMIKVSVGLTELLWEVHSFDQGKCRVDITCRLADIHICQPKRI